MFPDPLDIEGFFDRLKDLLDFTAPGSDFTLTVARSTRRSTIVLRRLADGSTATVDVPHRLVSEVCERIAVRIAEADGIILDQARAEKRGALSGIQLLALIAGGVVSFVAVTSLSWISRHGVAGLDRMLGVGVGVGVGVGTVSVMVVHEYGHVLALRSLGVATCSLPFLRYLGAFNVFDGAEEREARSEGWVGFAGPIAGIAASLGVVGLYVLTDYVPFLLVAVFSLMLIGINLLPVPPLDGGRVVAAVSPWLWIVGVVSLIGLVFKLGLVAAPILAVALWSVVRRLQERGPRAYRKVGALQRVALIGCYLATWAVVVASFALCAAVGGDALGR